MNRNEFLHKKIDGQVLLNERMENHTTFHIGGPVDILAVPHSVEDIKQCILYAKEKQIPFYIVGNGSKLLVSDKGIHGVVIKISQTLDWVKISGENITAGSGINLSDLIEFAKQNNLSGIEFATGIPGTLGGAIAMNAGANLGKMSDIVENVTILNPSDLQPKTLSKEECYFGYRESIFQKINMVILDAKLKLKNSKKKKIQETIDKFLENRQRTQPWVKFTAGSIFKNPPGISAGKLLDDLGLKGCRKGNAKFSEIHANFILNLGDAKANDILFLIKLAQDKAKKVMNIVLEQEIICLGSFK
jgi:UDP-N-acetylmuramate dehydrogenase